MLLSILLIAVITSLTSDNCDIGKYWQSERGYVVALCVNRDIEIENFKTKDYYDILGVFSGVEAKWWFNNDEFSDKNGRCINKSFAQSIVDSVKSGGNAVVEKFATQRKHNNP
jgi:DNA topoisomerase IA